MDIKGRIILSNSRDIALSSDTGVLSLYGGVHNSGNPSKLQLFGDDRGGTQQASFRLRGGVSADDDVAAADSWIKAADAFTTASTYQNGASLGLYGGDHATGGGLEGSVYIYEADGATPICRFHETAGVVVYGSGSETWAFDTAGNLLAQGTTLDDSITNGLVIASGSAPNSSPADACQLWVEDVGGAGQAELRVRDELGNVSNVSANVATYPDSITPSRRYPYVTMCEQRFAGVRTYVALHRLAELVQAWARTRGHLGPGENIIVHERIPREDWTKSEFEKAIQQRMADGVEIPKAQAVQVIEQEDGRQVERVRPGCRHDKRTGKYYRRRTRAEAVEAVQAGDLAPMPDWLRAMREN